MSSFAKIQIDTMWKTKHLKTVKWLFGFFLGMFMAVPYSLVSRNRNTKDILVSFELVLPQGLVDETECI